jgi:pimeloyl-ACP methyl ester carboxylesterase
MPFADTPSGRIHYEEQGEGEPLLCVMGLSADHLAWALQVPAWSERFRTIVFDNRDVGQSFQAEQDYEVSDMAADTLALADALELDSFHLLGMSLGGAVAQEVALAAPERVRTLTLVVTYPGAGNWGRERARLWGPEVLRKSREEHVDYLIFYTTSEQFHDNPEQVEFLRNVILSNPHPQTPEAFVRQLDAGGRHEARDRLGSLTMPVHVIGAEHDTLVPVWKSKELAELIPGAELTIMERAPHGVNIENAQDFNAIVLDFLARVGAAAA